MRDRDRVIWYGGDGSLHGGTVERTAPLEVRVPDATGLAGCVYLVDPGAVLVALDAPAEPTGVPW